jgi:hypothetical protein
MSLVVTDITFDPDDVKFGGSACPQETPVCRPGLVLTETGSDECFASITMGGVAVGTKVKVQVKATVDCTGGQVPACVAYQQKLASEQGGTDFPVPQPNEPDTTPADQAPPSSDSVSPSDSSSDSGATTSS